MAEEQTGNTHQQQQSGSDQQSAQAQAGQAAETKTIVSGEQGQQQEQAQQQSQQQEPAKPAWPDDWRDKLAGGDADLRKRLDRFTDPTLVVKSWQEAERKISSGQMKKVLPGDAKPEEIAAYRKEMGIPDDPEKYPLEAPKEITLSDADKPVLEAVKKFAHEKALDPKTVQELTNWYLGNRELELQTYREAADNTVAERISELRTEYGGDFNKNVTIGNNFIAEVMGERGKELASIPLADGTPLGSHPLFVKFAAQSGRAYGSPEMIQEVNIGGTDVDTRINEIKKLMGDRQSDYWKGPKSAGLQEEYHRLITVRDRHNNRAA